MKNPQKVWIAIISTVIVAILIIGGVAYIFKVKNGVSSSSIDPNTGVTRSGGITFKNGEKYDVTVGKFDPPYVPKYRDPNSNFDLSKPTETLDALFSVPYGACSKKPDMMQKLYSLMTEETKQYLIDVDKESNSSLTRDCNDKQPAKSVLSYLYWVEIRKDGKMYRFVTGRDMTENLGSIFNQYLVNQNGKWLQTITSPFEVPSNPPSIESIQYDLLSPESYEAFVSKFFN